jgi:hypothetical protein
MMLHCVLCGTVGYSCCCISVGFLLQNLLSCTTAGIVLLLCTGGRVAALARAVLHWWEMQHTPW